VSSRTKYIALARALERQEGCRVGSGGAGTFVTRVRAQELPEHVRARLVPLLTAMTGAESRLIDGATHPPNPTMRRGPCTAIVEREQK
jgi:hypothetical protein